MKQLAVDIQVPQYLSDVGIPEAAIDEMADSAMTQTRLLVNNPRRLSRDDIVAIYHNGAVRPGSGSAPANGKGKSTPRPRAKTARVATGGTAQAKGGARLAPGVVTRRL